MSSASAQKIPEIYETSDLVWAKMRGFPHWPARVLPKPSGKRTSSYYVFFYGTHDVAWLPGKDLLPFKKYQQKFRATSQRQRPGLSEAVWEIEEDPDLQLSEHGSLLKKLLKSGKKKASSIKPKEEIKTEPTTPAQEPPKSSVEETPLSKAIATRRSARLQKSTSSSPATPTTHSTQPHLPTGAGEVAPVPVAQESHESQKSDDSKEDCKSEDPLPTAVASPLVTKKSSRGDCDSTTRTRRSKRLIQMQVMSKEAENTACQEESIAIENGESEEVVAMCNKATEKNDIEEHSIDIPSDQEIKKEVVDIVNPVAVDEGLGGVSSNGVEEMEVGESEIRTATMIENLEPSNQSENVVVDETALEGESLAAKETMVVAEGEPMPGNVGEAVMMIEQMSITEDEGPRNVEEAAREEEKTKATAEDPVDSEDQKPTEAAVDMMNTKATAEEPMDSEDQKPTEAAVDVMKTKAIAEDPMDSEDQKPTEAAVDVMNTKAIAEDPMDSEDQKPTEAAIDVMKTKAIAEEPMDSEDQKPTEAAVDVMNTKAIAEEPMDSEDQKPTEAAVDVMNTKAIAEDPMDSEDQKPTEAAVDVMKTKATAEEPMDSEDQKPTEAAVDVTTTITSEEIETSDEVDTTNSVNEKTMEAPTESVMEADAVEVTPPGEQNDTVHCGIENNDTTSDDREVAMTESLDSDKEAVSSQQTPSEDKNNEETNSSNPTGTLENPSTEDRAISLENNSNVANTSIIEDPSTKVAVSIENSSNVASTNTLENPSTEDGNGEASASITHTCSSNTVSTDEGISSAKTGTLDDGSNAAASSLEDVSGSTAVPLDNGNEQETLEKTKASAEKTTQDSSKKQKVKPPPQRLVTNSMLPTEALKTFNYNLKVSLIVGCAEPQKALKTLRTLMAYHFTASDIAEVKDLVTTLRKVRRYKGNSRVRSRANEVYNKIKGLFVTEEDKSSNPVTDENSCLKEQDGADATNVKKRKVDEDIPEKDMISLDVDANDKEDETMVNRRRSQRSALRGRVNYAELSGIQNYSSDDDQMVPEL